MKDSIEGISIGKHTGKFEIDPKMTLKGLTTKVEVKVYYDTGETNFKKEEVNISFGAYIPEEGDIVYSDCTFSKTLNKYKTPIGFVFWSKLIKEDIDNHTNTYDIRVMAFEKLSNNNYEFGPSNYVPNSYYDYSGLNAEA